MSTLYDSACMRLVSERNNRSSMCISKVILDLLNTQFDVGNEPMSIATLSTNSPKESGKKTTTREIQIKRKQEVLYKANNLQEVFQHVLVTLNNQHKKVAVETLRK